MNQHQQSVISASTLYVVPTPIGNLGDITHRALEVLKSVDLIAAEDTRHTGLLLQHFAINARLFALHDHNEQQKAEQLLAKLQEGQSIALVSDAGTPLINDPGYHLVRRCREAGIRVVPLPGACAATTALCAAGVASDRFCYEGSCRRNQGAQGYADGAGGGTAHADFLRIHPPPAGKPAGHGHRLGPAALCGAGARADQNLGIHPRAPVGELLAWVQEDEVRRRGEMVLIVEGHKAQEDALPLEALRTLALLQKELPLKKAAALAAEIHGVKKNALYKHALEQQQP